MSGGRGDLATTEESKKLDKMLKEARAQLKQEFSGVFVVKAKLYENAWIKYFGLKPAGVGCEPDGGLWYLNDQLVSVFEGKHQGPKGNADERWWKNASIINDIFKFYRKSKGVYHTFASGAACDKKWKGNEQLSSVIFPIDVRWSLSKEGFTYEELLEGMRNTLNGILGKHNIPHVYPEERGILDV
tara:strand:- start:1038 stop:1595 length:558 start_codon:yes stop_codon:yes gene_type:complete